MGWFEEGFSMRMWSQVGRRGEQHWCFMESGTALHDAVTEHTKILEKDSNFSIGEFTSFITL